MLERLRALDPADWPTGLSSAGSRAAWLAALSCIGPDALARSIPGTPPRAVLIIASGNVFTAPVEWCVQLAHRGVRVLLKPATGQESIAHAIATAIPGVEVRTWEGGDLAAEGLAMREADGILGFGRAETLNAIGQRIPPGVRYLPFGPKFGISIVSAPGKATVMDHVLYDGRGCMSPAAVFARTSDIDLLATLLGELEGSLPRGPVTPEEAANLRARVTLARAVGERRSASNWCVLRLPPVQFWPIALPRLITVHPFNDVAEVAAAIGQYRVHLGTIATDLPGFDPVSVGLVHPALPPPRLCYPGEMQRPPADRLHDGVDVLAALWMSVRPTVTS